MAKRPYRDDVLESDLIQGDKEPAVPRDNDGDSQPPPKRRKTSNQSSHLMQHIQDGKSKGLVQSSSQTAPILPAPTVQTTAQPGLEYLPPQEVQSPGDKYWEEQVIQAAIDQWANDSDGAHIKAVVESLRTTPVWQSRPASWDTWDTKFELLLDHRKVKDGAAPPHNVS